MTNIGEYWWVVSEFSPLRRNQTKAKILYAATRSILFWFFREIYTRPPLVPDRSSGPGWLPALFGPVEIFVVLKFGPGRSGTIHVQISDGQIRKFFSFNFWLATVWYDRYIVLESLYPPCPAKTSS